MKQKVKSIIIKITNKGVFYNEHEYIQWSNTNFPSKDNFNFNDRYDIYWEVALRSFDEESKMLELEVVNYEVLDMIEAFVPQKPKSAIERLVFKQLKWAELESVMNWYTQNEFNEISDSTIEVVPEKEVNSFGLTAFDFGSVEMDEPKEFTFKVQHSLMKTKFCKGFVEVEKRIDGVPGKVLMILKNSNIIPEFDHVKSFFAKAIGKRKIEITGSVDFDKNGVPNVSCHSEEIEQINETVITNVKRLKLQESILNPKVVKGNKSLFTPDEFFDSNEDKLLGNSIGKTDKDILKEILRIDEIRNKQQLIYLSGKLQSKRTTLRFTLSPKFGFLFHSEGDKMDHFIWELLNSHATYIWSIDREGLPLERKFQLLEKEINFIRDHGRMIYLKNEHSSDFVFNKINHGSSKANLKDSFPKWKLRINEKLS